MPTPAQKVLLKQLRDCSELYRLLMALYIWREERITLRFKIKLEVISFVDYCGRKGSDRG